MFTRVWLFGVNLFLHFFNRLAQILPYPLKQKEMTMKKILLTLMVIATTFAAAEAQTKKTSKKKAPKVSAEAKLKSDIAKIKESKHLKTDSMRMAQLQSDSIRIEDERLVEETKAVERAAWKEQKLREVDSTNKAKWANESAAKDEWYAIDRSQEAMNKAAKLNDMQGRQVKEINQSYISKAKAIKADMNIEAAERSTQLASLNTERREKIKAVVGTSKEKALEKQRLKMVETNVDAAAFKWVDEAAPIAVKQ